MCEKTSVSPISQFSVNSIPVDTLINAYSATSKITPVQTDSREHLISSLTHQILTNHENTPSSRDIDAGQMCSPNPPDLKERKGELPTTPGMTLPPLLDLEAIKSIDKSAKNTKLYTWLKGKGYAHIVDELNKHKGQPWDSISELSSPILMEQLLHLHQLLENKNSEKYTIESISDFALRIAKSATRSAPSSQSPESPDQPSISIEEAKSILGQMIYLVDQDPINAFICISYSENTEDSIAKIRDKFHVTLEITSARLHDLYQAHCNTQLQSADISIHSMLPRELAKILITSLGTINIGIIDTLSEAFVVSKSTPTNHQINLAYALKLIQRSPKLREEFHKVLAPISSDMLSQDVIRASLNLSSAEPITHIHAKQAALGAILSHLRQNKEGSCFATSLAIEILSSHLEFCFKDLTHLIRESKLTRTIHSVRRDVPFIKRIRDDDLDKEITLDQEGYVLVNGSKKTAIWNAPGIQAVCTAIGIVNPQESVRSILSHLISHTNHETTTTLRIEELIKHLCRESVRSDPVKTKLIGSLFEQACFTFSSQTANPLLKVWENTIASMAEVQESGMVKKAIINSTLYSLQWKLTQHKIPPSPLIQRSLMELQKTLFERISLRYDPSIDTSSGDHPSLKEGGFVLYYKGQRIDNPKSFVNFMKNNLNEIREKITKEAKPEAIGKVTHLFSLFNWYLVSDDFLKKTIEKYHPSNQLLQPPIAYHKLNFTPWITKTGNNSRNVLEVYLESERTFISEHFLTEGPEERLIKIIQMGQRLSSKEKLAYEQNPNKLAQFRVPGHHAASLMLGHPSLSKAWNQSGSASDWVKDTVVKPGVEISQTPIDEVTQRNLLQKIETEILPTFMKKTHIPIYKRLIDIIPKELSIMEYRQAVVSILRRLDSTYIPLLEKLSRQIDTALIESLAPTLQKQFKDSVVQFADTNWNNGIHDLHFCFAVNPGTGNLEVLECQENGEKLSALDQKYWLSNQEWEFFSLPEEIIPDDEVENLVN